MAKATAKAARQALAAGDYNACAQIASQLRPRTAEDGGESYFLMAMALDGVGKVKEALTCAAKAAKLHPTAETCAHLGRLSVQLHRDEEARTAADTALALPSEDALTLDTIGNVYARLGDHEAAIKAFDRAVKAAPGNTGYRFNLAASYGFFGNTDAAEQHYKAILDIEPSHAKAWFGLVKLRKQTADLPDLDKAINTAKDPSDVVRLRYAAAKTAEDLGDHGQVYAQLSKANAVHKTALGTSVSLELDNFAAIKSAFETPSYLAGQSSAQDAPIFITGMPRTGTTLTDRILSSHPEVTSAGELQSIPLAVKQLSQSATRAILDPGTIDGLEDISPNDLGALYMQLARQHSGARAGRFVDKLPLNFLYIGYIARALPNASIICLRRSPMDTVWSNYKNLFATTSLYYRYSYDLEDTARYYIAFDKMMAFWKRMFPGRILEFSYEGLIADQEPQTRALLEHCGLSWAPECLNFHTNTAAVATPSAMQVRQPLSGKSIGFWRHYEAHMSGVKALFEDAGIEAV